MPTWPCHRCGLPVGDMQVHDCAWTAPWNPQPAGPQISPALPYPSPILFHPFTLDLTCPCGAHARAEAPTEAGVKELALGFYEAHERHTESEPGCEALRAVMAEALESLETGPLREGWAARVLRDSLARNTTQRSDDERLP